METLLAINLEDVSEKEREELYKTLAWVDIETQSLNYEQLKTLFKTSQQLLRLKQEQVEAILQELDELAVKNTEEKIEKDRDRAESAKSWKSRSTTIEYENLEQKYLDLKSKFKRTAHTNEKRIIEIEMLNKKIKRLEKENRQLESEMQNRFQHETESDNSESFKNQQKELASVVENKNLQISELLRDIEDVEKENLILREKLSSVKDELSNATNEMVGMMETIKSKDLLIQELKDSSVKNLSTIEDLQEELQQVKNQKIFLENDFAEFSSEVEQKVDKWKILLEKKNAEIEQLKSNRPKLVEISSKDTSADASVEQTYLEHLQKIISERDEKLMELKSQLEVSTKELIEGAELVKELQKETDFKTKKINELSENLNEIKKQLEKSHQRCTKLQDEVKHTENVVQFKDAEMKEILKSLKEQGYEELAEKLKQMHNLKSKGILQEKQVTDLVKTANKMQENLDVLEQENALLREKLDLEQGDELFDSKYVLKEEKLKKENEKLIKSIGKLKEEKLQLKTEIKDLNKKMANLTDQIIDLNEKPNLTYESTKTPKVDSKVEKELDSQIRALSEENEALRKGLHDILDSVKIKQETSPREIKSEVLEKLLKALDVKHISGWYHPAMRLQAELHTLEGVNKELRDQLQQARIELYNLKTEPIKLVKNMKSPDDIKDNQENQKQVLVGAEQPRDILLPVIAKDFDSLEELKLNILKMMMILNDSNKKHETAVDLSVKSIKENINILHKNCIDEKDRLEKELQNCKDGYNEYKQLDNIKCDLPNTLNTDVGQINIILGKRVEFLFKLLDNSYKNLEEEKSRYTYLKNNFVNEQLSSVSKILNLQGKLQIAENKLAISIDKKQFDETKSTLDNILLKYRKLIDETKEKSKEESLEIQILKKIQQDLNSENEILRSQLKSALTIKYKEANNKTGGGDKMLAEKLAESQVKELTEKQRADHTNNLYELVKDQLNKSEDKFKEFSKYGENLLLKNITLQEQLNIVENQLTTFVDQSIFKDLQDKYNQLLTQRNELSNQITDLKEKLSKIELQDLSNKTWNDQKEQELFNLRHQIVDLMSSSEDKILIGQLHADIIRYRQKEVEFKEEIESLKNHVSELKQEYKNLDKELEQSKSSFDLLKANSNKKNRVLQDLLFKQKTQYFGCIPLCVEEAYIETLRIINKQKHETFMSLQKTRELENKNLILNEHLNGNNDDDSSQDSKNVFQLRRQCEFKENQIQYLTDRIKVQDEQIFKLEEELLSTYRSFDFNGENKKKVKKPNLVKQIVSQEYIGPDQSLDVPDKVTIAPTKILRNIGCQISFEPLEQNPIRDNNDLLVFKTQMTSLLTDVTNLKTRISNLQLENSTKEQYITQLKSSLSNQLNEKQRRIVYLEEKLNEIQEKGKQRCRNETGAGDGARVQDGSFGEEEIISLKASVKTLQESINLKDKEIIRYQTLLKDDRDKHSLAAANLQHELQDLQKTLMVEKEKNESLEETAIYKQKYAAVEKYVTQVHALEHHLAELHTSTASLEARLQASQQEASRWRILASDRLRAMEELGRDLDDQHKKELQAYKEECEKFIEYGKDSPINSYRNKPIFENESVESTTRIDADILKLIREKDSKIRELTSKLKQQLRTKSSESRYSLESLPYDRTDVEYESVFKENEVLRRRCEQLVKKEAALKDEIRELKSQLLKKPNFASLNKSERSIKYQLQKKVSTLEEEIVELNKKLEQQVAINEKHKQTSGEDFEKWKKQKYWQENYEKFKNKLKEKEEECEKVTQTCTGYRLLIERLEREKLTLENRNKMLANVTVHPTDNRELQILQIENERFAKEVEDLNLKLEMQQHHSGGLGAAMLQEKLESQERKIAVLELSAKGSSEMRSEIERLQSTTSSLHKNNLCLEAENLELKMDLEKCNKETPHLQEQIQYLENYIEVLKKEKVQTELETSKHSPADATSGDNKTVAQLERTVFILKRVVEKLQAENKRLLSGKRPVSERSVSAEKLKRDHLRLKEQYTESLQKISKLESQLTTVNKKLQLISSGKSQSDKVEALTHEIAKLREELGQKTHLLDKVKSLLQRAAAKEKLLLQEISRLKNENDIKEMGFPSPVMEDSEVSSDT